MPMCRTDVARDDLAATSGRLATRVAENGVSFGVLGLEKIQRLVVACATPTTLSQPHSDLSLRKSKAVGILPGLLIHRLNKLAILSSGNAIKVVFDVSR